MDYTQSIDNIAHYKDLFLEFGIDIREVAPHSGEVDQFTLETLNMAIEREMEADRQYQFDEWIVRDRAYEAVGLVEADGPGIGSNGNSQMTKEYVKKARKKGPFISLVRTNRDRIVAKLQSVPVEVNAVPTREKDLKITGKLNRFKDSILKKNNFDFQFNSILEDATTYGTGMGTIEFGPDKDNPDLSRLLKIGSTEGLTMEQFYYLQHAVASHKIRYADTFEFVRCRFARGVEASNYNHPSHRWLHRVKQTPVAQLRSRFKNVEGKIVPNMARVFEDMNPNSGHYRDAHDTATEMITWVRFPVVEDKTIYLKDPEGGKVPLPISVERYAVAKITRIQDIGVVDIEIDRYEHNKIPVFAFVYFPSKRHSCGIGSVKFGRDAQLIHNKLHIAMLRMFDTMSKGGGFVDSRLGLTAEQLKKRSEEGSYFVVKMPEHLQGKSLKDFVVDTRMSTFPSSYPELLGFHSQSVDESMNVPNAQKGFKQGSSGRQELILQQQADAVHSVVISQLKRSVHELSVMLYSNIAQFNDKPFVFYFHDPLSGKSERIEMNMPQGFYPFFNEETGELDLQPFGVINDIKSIMYQIEVTTDSIVPKDPAERANFFFTLFGNTVGLVKDPEARVYLRFMNRNGMKIPEIEEAMDIIDKYQENLMKQQQQAESQSRQEELQQDNKKLGIDAFKALLDKQKVDNETAQLNANLQQQ